MKDQAQLLALLVETVRRWEIPGLAVGAVLGDEVIFAEALGVQNTETRVPVTLESIFCVASVSKCFVATAIMQLVDRGQLDLDAPVVEYLPYFRMADERYQQIST